ncbi:hypothetical protein [Natronolimnobius baerhuensis]|nr:hypothetical protein [Natronolimnobius baerhuensis]
MAGLAGCLEGVQEHFGLQGIVPLEIYSEAEDAYNLQLQAREDETGRETYDESYAVTPEESIVAPNLERTNQNLQVVKYERDTDNSIARAVSITDETELIVVYIRDDDLVVEVRQSDDVEVYDGDDGEIEANATDLDENGETDTEDEHSESD